MARHTSGRDGAGAPANGQRTPPMDEPLDPGPDGRHPVNHKTSEPKEKTPPGRVSDRKRRLGPMKIPPDIIP